ncbi:hypothetical protein V8D89_000303 [Ganoderma adspersum]
MRRQTVPPLLQATFFGQVMLVYTLVSSWGYNVFISSIDREDIQIHIRRGIRRLDGKPVKGGGEGVAGKIQKFEFGTRTAMATFACLALRPGLATPLQDSSKILDALLLNDTEVWTGGRTS